MSSDALHDALTTWAMHGDAYSFVAPLMSNIDKDQVPQLICMFLHVTPEWLEENNVGIDEAYAALREAVKLNDWSEILQAMMVLDTIRIDEVVQMLSALRGQDA